MTVQINARMAPANWPEESALDDLAMPRFDARPHAFAVLFGAFVIRVAGDGSLVLVALPSAVVRYLRTGHWPPRIVVSEPEPGVMRVREVGS